MIPPALGFFMLFSVISTRLFDTLLGSNTFYRFQLKTFCVVNLSLPLSWCRTIKSWVFIIFLFTPPILWNTVKNSTDLMKKRSALINLWGLDYFYIFDRSSLRKKSPYSELFWSAFSHIRTGYGEKLRISPYSVWMQENTD